MSLSRSERTHTARELKENFELSGLSQQALMEASGLSEDRFRAALNVDSGMHPQDVWLLRDLIEDSLLAQGLTPKPYSKLTDDMREAAGVWFGYERPHPPAF